MNSNVNTKKTNYLYLVAISNNRRKNTLEIDAVKILDGCFFYSYDKIDADSFHLETLDIDIVFDKRLSKVLHNDSIYVSLHGTDLYTMQVFHLVIAKIITLVIDYTIFSTLLFYICNTAILLLT